MMNNYEYIIASLPDLDKSGAEGTDTASAVDGILEQLSERDSGAAALVIKGFSPENLGAGFYHETGACGNAFIREYFRYDMNVRNVKVEWLNSSLGRPAGTDVLTLDEDCVTEFPDRDKVLEVLNGQDIIGREKGLDDIMWAKADELTVLAAPFCLDVILAFIVKLNIVQRWLRLDPETGRALFRKMVGEIKENYTI